MPTLDEERAIRPCLVAVGDGPGVEIMVSDGYALVAQRAPGAVPEELDTVRDVDTADDLLSALADPGLDGELRRRLAVTAGMR